MTVKRLIKRLVKPLFWNRPFADRTLCHFLPKRLRLPDVPLSSLIDGFDDQAVTLRQIPRGSWSTPLRDIVMLLKLAGCAKPMRLLEIGSFRGYTALYLAQHTGPDARIVTVDRFVGHGEAYRATPFANKIERRVGEITAAMFAEDKPESFDLIFIDADHSYKGVRRDTELVLPFVSKNGFVVWHDYANWGFFDSRNGVPEYLGELAKKLPLAHASGSDLAVYSPAWQEGAPRERYMKAARANSACTEFDPWKTDLLRE